MRTVRASHVPLAVALCIGFTGLVTAAGPGEPLRGIPFRGHIDLDGAAVTEATTVRFELYDDDAAGTPLWTSTPDPVITPSNGAFSHVLGSTNALPESVFVAATLYLQVSIMEDDTPVVLGGRQVIYPASQAVRASKADHLTVDNGVRLTKGTLYRGDTVPPTNDLGLYSQVPGHYIRIVTDNAPINFFTDGSAANNFVGGTPAAVVTAAGDLNVTGRVRSSSSESRNILSTTGVLPKSSAFSTAREGRYLVLATGTALRPSTAGAIGMLVRINGSIVTSSYMVVNQTSSHATMPTAMGVVTLAAGAAHTVDIANHPDAPGMATDVNDTFNVMLVDLP